MVAKRRTVVTCRLCCCRVHKYQQSRGSGVLWLRNAELSSFRLLCFGALAVSTVTGIGGVVVARRRTVVTFRLLCCRRVQKCQQSHSAVVGRGRETQNCRHFSTPFRSISVPGTWSSGDSLDLLLCGAQVSLEQTSNSMAWMEPIATNFLASIACAVNLSHAQSLAFQFPIKLFFFGLTPLYYISSTVGRSCWARRKG